uniref:Flagellar protein FlgN n=1 Tax=Bosea sp. NBC_00436 TaxID=2969620 RepID=A0A9E8CTV0_9HYPH
MLAAKPILDERPRIADALSARALIEAVLEALGALSHLVGEETELVRAGRLPEAMTREPRKTELAGIYMRGVEQVKLNAVALARLVPDQVKRLKDAHLAFQGLIETNQIVLATARAVSESIVRDLAADANKPMRANGYGPAATVGAGVFARPNSGPLVVSRRL